MEGTLGGLGVHALAEESQVLHLLSDQAAGEANVFAANHHLGWRVAEENEMVMGTHSGKGDGLITTSAENLRAGLYSCSNAGAPNEVNACLSGRASAIFHEHSDGEESSRNVQRFAHSAAPSPG